MKATIVTVKNCAADFTTLEGCPCHYDGHCNIKEDVDCDIVTYGLPPNGVVGDCAEGGIPEQCPLRSQNIIIQLHKDAKINTGKEKGYNQKVTERMTS